MKTGVQRVSLLRSTLGRLALALVVAAPLFTAAAQAQLTMHVDSVNNTVYFTGSDSGSTELFNNDHHKVRWIDGSLSGSDANLSTVLAVSPAPDYTPQQAPVLMPNAFWIDYRYISAQANVTVTGQGPGTTVSYSSAESYIEGKIGSTIPNTVGTGFSPINVVAAGPPTSTILQVYSPTGNTADGMTVVGTGANSLATASGSDVILDGVFSGTGTFPIPGGSSVSGLISPEGTPRNVGNGGDFSTGGDTDLTLRGSFSSTFTAGAPAFDTGSWRSTGKGDAVLQTVGTTGDVTSGGGAVIGQWEIIAAPAPASPTVVLEVLAPTGNVSDGITITGTGANALANTATSGGDDVVLEGLFSSGSLPIVSSGITTDLQSLQNTPRTVGDATGIGSGKNLALRGFWTPSFLNGAAAFNTGSWNFSGGSGDGVVQSLGTTGNVSAPNGTIIGQWQVVAPPNQDPDCSGAAIADQDADIHLEASISGADVSGVTDPDGDSLTITVSPTKLVLGANTVTVTADDGNGGVSSCDITVNVVLNPVGLAVILRQGVDGYTGVRDTRIDNSNATTGDTNYSSEELGTLDGRAGYRRRQGLLAFDNLFGGGAGQIPPGSTIHSASLFSTFTGTNGGYGIYRMLTDWDVNTITFNNTLLDGNTEAGLQTDDVETSSTATGFISHGTTVDVTVDVALWAAGTPNYGWHIAGPGGTDFPWAMSENADPNLRPRLYVDFSPPPNRDPDCSGAAIADQDADIHLEASISGANVSGVTDPDGDSLTITVSPTKLVLGANTVTVTADDGNGGVVSCDITVNVVLNPVGLAVILRQGVDGYTGVRDTRIDNSNATTGDTNYSSEELGTLDGRAGYRRRQGLLAFDNLFGGGAGQIPPGSTIHSASLFSTFTGTNGGYGIYRMLTDWDVNTITFNNTLLDGNTEAGLQTDDVETSSTATGFISHGTTVDVTADVALWAAGTPNYGWHIAGPGGTDFPWAMSENADPNLRPRLYVDFSPPPNRDPDCSGAAIADQDADIHLEASISGANVSGVTDPDGDSLTITVSPTKLVLGANTVTVTADDGNGGVVSCDITVNVVLNPVGLAVILRQGVDGYTGVRDTRIDNSNATTGDTNYSSEELGTLDGRAGYRRRQGLLAFDNLFGTGAGQIPPGSTIHSASLFSTFTGTNGGYGIYRMLTDWDVNTITFNNTLLDGNTEAGLQTDDVETSSTATGFISHGTTVDVTADVALWAAGTPNYGWHIAGPGGTDFPWAMSENADPNLRPRLYVDFSPPPEPQLFLFTYTTSSWSPTQAMLDAGADPNAAELEIGLFNSGTTAVSQTYSDKKDLVHMKFTSGGYTFNWVRSCEPLYRSNSCNLTTDATGHLDSGQCTLTTDPGSDGLPDPMTDPRFNSNSINLNATGGTLGSSVLRGSDNLNRTINWETRTAGISAGPYTEPEFTFEVRGTGSGTLLDGSPFTDASVVYQATMQLRGGTSNLPYVWIIDGTTYTPASDDGFASISSGHGFGGAGSSVGAGSPRLGGSTLDPAAVPEWIDSIGDWRFGSGPHVVPPTYITSDSSAPASDTVVGGTLTFSALSCLGGIIEVRKAGDPPGTPPNRAPNCTNAAIADLDADANCEATISAMDVTGVVDPDGDSVTITVSPTTLSLGANTVTVTADDGKGGVSSCDITVNVVDNTPPVPDVATLPDATGTGTVTVSTVPTATDACAGAVNGTTSDPLTYNTPGSYTISWTYDDGNGNQSQQTQTVVVNPVGQGLFLRQGVDGYAGTRDTYTDANQPTTNFSTSDQIVFDNRGGTGSWREKDGLLAFDDLFGPGAGQLPPGAVINSATLILTGGLEGSSFHRMLTAWDVSTITHENALLNGNTLGGIQADDLEAATTATTTAARFQTAIDVTGDVAAWSAGTLNHGWYIQGTASTDRVFSSSEDPVEANRPRLIIDFSPPPDPQLFLFTYSTTSWSPTQAMLDAGADPSAAELEIGLFNGGTSAASQTYDDKRDLIHAKFTSGGYGFNWVRSCDPRFISGSCSLTTDAAGILDSGQFTLTMKPGSDGLPDLMTDPRFNKNSINLNATGGTIGSSVLRGSDNINRTINWETRSTSSGGAFTEPEFLFEIAATASGTLPDGSPFTDAPVRYRATLGARGPFSNLAYEWEVDGTVFAGAADDGSLGISSGTGFRGGGSSVSAGAPVFRGDAAERIGDWRFGDGPHVVAITYLVADSSIPTADQVSGGTLTFSAMNVVGGTIEVRKLGDPPGTPPNRAPDCSAAAIADQDADANCEATISAADVTGVVDPDGDSVTIAVSPTTLSLGANTVTVTADDGKGGVSSCDITVNVIDITPPVPDVANLPDATGSGSVTVSTTPTATDACAGSINGTTSDPLTYSTPGSYTITWTYDDGNGNQIQQTQTVVVSSALAVTMALGAEAFAADTIITFEGLTGPASSYGGVGLDLLDTTVPAPENPRIRVLDPSRFSGRTLDPGPNALNNSGPGVPWFPTEFTLPEPVTRFGFEGRNNFNDQWGFTLFSGQTEVGSLVLPTQNQRNDPSFYFIGFKSDTPFDRVVVDARLGSNGAADFDNLVFGSGPIALQRGNLFCNIQDGNAVGRLGVPDGVGADYRVAGDFITSAELTSVTTAKIVVSNGDIVDRTVLLSIWTESGADTPGTLVGSFEPISIAAGAPTGEYGASVSTPITLAANTRYWLVAAPGEGNTGPPETLAFTVGVNDLADPGSLFAAFPGGGGLNSSNAGASWRDEGLIPQFCLDGLIIPPNFVSVTASDPDAGEPSNNGEFTVALPTGEVAPAGGLTVSVTVEGTATEGADFAAIGTSTVIPEGSNSVTVAIDVSDDDESEVAESVILTVLPSPTSSYVPALAPLNSATAIIEEEAGDQGALDTIRTGIFPIDDLADPAKKETLWGPNANPNGNSWPNIFEIVFGEDPLNPNPEPPVTEGNRDGCATLTFRARKDLLPEVEIQLLVSDSPRGGFRNTTTVPVIEPDPNDPNFCIMTLEDDTPAGPGQTRFSKLVITE